jgi:enamine deaminase RidA (YjgF/YER057c/UK114 family)
MFLLVISTQLFAQDSVQASKRHYINLPRPANATSLPFSDAVQVGNTLYIAGRLGIDTKSGKIPVDLEEELKNLFDGFKATLAQANMTMDDLTMVQIFCTDLSLYDKFNAVYRASFGKDVPARAFVGASALLRGAHFEMMGTATSK